MSPSVLWLQSLAFLPRVISGKKWSKSLPVLQTCFLCESEKKVLVKRMSKICQVSWKQWVYTVTVVKITRKYRVPLSAKTLVTLMKSKQLNRLNCLSNKRSFEGHEGKERRKCSMNTENLKLPFSLHVCIIIFGEHNLLCWRRRWWWWLLRVVEIPSANIVSVESLLNKNDTNCIKVKDETNDDDACFVVLTQEYIYSRISGKNVYPRRREWNDRETREVCFFSLFFLREQSVDTQTTQPVCVPSIVMIIMRGRILLLLLLLLHQKAIKEMFSSRSHLFLTLSFRTTSLGRGWLLK